MDTFISVGVLAAFGWSVYALFLGDAGMTGMRMTFQLLPERGSGAPEIYLEVASTVTVFILAGRYFKARAKKRSGSPSSAGGPHAEAPTGGGRGSADRPRRTSAPTRYGLLCNYVA